MCTSQVHAHPYFRRDMRCISSPLMHTHTHNSNPLTSILNWFFFYLNKKIETCNKKITDDEKFRIKLFKKRNMYFYSHFFFVFFHHSNKNIYQIWAIEIWHLSLDLMYFFYYAILLCICVRYTWPAAAAWQTV